MSEYDEYPNVEGMMESREEERASEIESAFDPQVAFTRLMVRIEHLTAVCENMEEIVLRIKPLADKIPANLPDPPPGMFSTGMFPPFPKMRG